MTTHSTRRVAHLPRRALTTALALAICMTAATAEAGSLQLPAWDQIFSPSGGFVDHYDAFGAKGSNGIPDYVELFGGIEAEFVRDNLSNGIAVDMSALLPSEDLSQQVVFNGEVRGAHDLGNLFVLKSRSLDGSLQAYAGVERMVFQDATFVEFEFNQAPVTIGRGAPWTLNGQRTRGDLLVRMNFDRGRLGAVEVSRWGDGGFTTLESIRGSLEGGCGGHAALVFCVSAPPMELSGDGFEVWDTDFRVLPPEAASDFLELGIDLGSFAGINAQVSSIQVRTPEDFALNTFKSRELPADSLIPVIPVLDGRLD